MAVKPNDKYRNVRMIIGLLLIIYQEKARGVELTFQRNEMLNQYKIDLKRLNLLYSYF